MADKKNKTTKKFNKLNKQVKQVVENIEKNSNDSLNTSDYVFKRDNFFKQINKMFAHKSKLSNMVSSDVIQNYKNTYFYLFEKIEKGELPSHEDFFCGNVLAENIYKNKYFLKGTDNSNLIEEKAEDVYMRMASCIASVEENQKLREKFAEEFYLALYEGHFLPGGRVLAGAGDLYRLKTLANCFVSVIENDSLEGIYKTAYEAARTYSFGGGIGIDISPLRPKDSKVHNAADKSTGAVSFMELYSLTTGLIGQSGRRGALMLTIDVKHPDVLDFVHVKKEPNWTTNQIMSRAEMAGIYSQEQLEHMRTHIIENTQVRFANISIKVSDEFMSAVEEQNLYGKDKILVYKKKDQTGPVQGKSADEYNYSYGISNKDLSKYELVEKFDNVNELNDFLRNSNFSSVTECDLKDINNRDFYGDFVLESNSVNYDFAIRYSGDFMTYYEGKSVGILKEMHKARDIWNKFIEGNYKTAEPGLIFWSQMSKYSPSNYVGKPIACTNPCFSGDNFVFTSEGPKLIKDIIGKPIDVIVDDKVISTEGFFKTGDKQVFEVQTKEGFKIKITDNHKMHKVESEGDLSWVELCDLKVGDKLKLQNHMDRISKWEGNGTFEDGFLLGMLVGDGTFSDNVARISVWNDDLLKNKVIETIKPFMKNDKFEGWEDSFQEGKWNIKSKYVTDLANIMGVEPKVKEITHLIECASSSFQKGFLNAFFSCDGSVQYNKDKGDRCLRLNQSDLPRLEAVQRMLARFGIFSKIYFRRESEEKVFPNKPEKKYILKDNYELSITKKSLLKFTELIGIEGKKKSKLEEIVKSYNHGPYKDKFVVEISDIVKKGIEPVYDIQVPGENRLDVNGFDAHNCGEVPLEDGGACNLGSLNLARMVKNPYTNNATVDWDLISKTSQTVTRFLDNVVWWNETLNALDKQRDSANITRRIGIGVMGIADMFNQLGIGYDSDEGIDLLQKVLNSITQNSYKTSALLSKEKGPAPCFDFNSYKENPFFIEVLEDDVKQLIEENGLRNIAIMSIAPTGTISNAICGYKDGNKNYLGVSGGIEPIFALYYTRRSEQMSEGSIYKIFHNNVQAYIDAKNLQGQVDNAEGEEGLKKILPSHFFQTAHNITPDMRVKIQGVAQKYIDHSISSTVNLSEDIEPETISDIYLNAWKNGLKGITVYRDGSRYPILSIEGQETKFQKFKDKKFKIKVNNEEKEFKGNDVIATSDGRLTTIYHEKNRD